MPFVASAVAVCRQLAKQGCQSINMFFFLFDLVYLHTKVQIVKTVILEAILISD